MAIDTLKVARRLREAGFDEAQADAVIAAVQEGAEGAEFATKADLALLAAELRAEIAAVRSEMREMEQRLIARIESVRGEITTVRGEIATLKSELLGRMFQMILSAVMINIVAVAGLMFALVKLLGH
jgi:DNA-binding transcriptional MerR regulator